MSQSDTTQVRCIWCGVKGGFVNRLNLLTDISGSVLAECDYCRGSEYYRKVASSGNGN